MRKIFARNLLGLLSGLFIFGSITVATSLIQPRAVTFPMRQAGEILYWAGSSCPTGTVALDGSSLLRTGTYASLFAVMSTTYGAADGTHFTLPNASGAVIRGSGTQTISSVSYTGTRGTAQRDQMPSHNHRIYANGGGSFTSITNGSAHAIGAITSGSGEAYANTMGGSGAVIIEATGTSTEVRMANIVLLACIIY